MGVEIERKFLVTGDSWRFAVRDSRALRQGYLAIDEATTVRVRTDGQEARITIKGPTRGCSRPEFEYAVPANDAEELLGLCRGRLIEKVRHRVAVDGHLWEIDEFRGANAGLVLAELELGSADEEFPHPGWLGAEVTDDARYANANLSLRPFKDWARLAS